MHKLESIKTQTGIATDVVTIQVGPTTVRAYTHGAINELCHNSKDVTAQRPLEQQLVSIENVSEQRGGNPLHGPMAGRYDDRLIAQPGPKNIHGVFSVLEWKLIDIDDKSNTITMRLEGDEWKGSIVDYYLFAASIADPSTEQRQSLDRFLTANETRFNRNREVMQVIASLRSILDNKVAPQNISTLQNYIWQLIDSAFGGSTTLTRRITIERWDNKDIVGFCDALTLENTSEDVRYVDASGFHTYFNTFLEEIVMPEGFWPGNKVPKYYDEDLPDVWVRELNQMERLDRRVFIFPDGELLLNANQIIYKDPKTVGHPEVAVENWRQPGNANGYPKKGKVIKPRELSTVAIRIIVAEGGVVPVELQEYIDSCNLILGGKES